MTKKKEQRIFSILCSFTMFPYPLHKQWKHNKIWTNLTDDQNHDKDDFAVKRKCLEVTIYFSDTPF